MAPPRLAELGTINFLVKLSAVVASCVGLRGPRDFILSFIELLEDGRNPAPSAGRVIDRHASRKKFYAHQDESILSCASFSYTESYHFLRERD